MKVVYESTQDRLNQVIDAARRDGRVIKYIVLTKAEWADAAGNDLGLFRPYTSYKGVRVYPIYGPNGEYDDSNS